jgi:hypothetical protein
MKNLPSFEEYKKYDHFLERTESDLVAELRSLETADPYHSVNEGQIMNSLKNTLSKFFLGSASRVSMLDEARKIILELELDLIEKRNEFELAVDKINSQIDELSKTEENDKVVALGKEREAKAKEMEAYIKAQRLKIKKSKEVANKLVDGNARRREYLMAGYSEDEIAIAELEYKLAKERSEESSVLKDYEDKIKTAKAEYEEKSSDLKSKMEDVEKEKADDESTGNLRVDPREEKKKISSRKGRDIIQRKNELEKDIADIRSSIERKLNRLSDKISKSKTPISARSVNPYKMDLLELASSLDSKTNLLALFRNLGKTENEITNSLKGESDFTKMANQINQVISDGNDANSGTKKIISEVFSGGNTVTVDIINSARKKLNK